MKIMASKDDIKLFVSETEDHVQRVEDAVLKMEENPADTKLIETLFFAFHSLKGLSALMGLEKMSRLCHHLETFIQKGKDGGIVDNKDEFTSLLFDSLDILRSMVAKFKKNEFQDLDEVLLNEIKDRTAGFEALSKVPLYQPPPIDKVNALSNDKTNHFYAISCKIQQTCMFKKVRLFFIFRTLNSLGQVCQSNPDADLLESGQFDFDFDVYMTSKSIADPIKKALNEILEIEEVRIMEMEANQFVSAITTSKENAKLRSKQDGDAGNQQRLDLLDSTAGSIKIELNTMETLMNNFSELIVIRNKLNQILEKKQIWETTRLFGAMDKLFLEIQGIIFKLKLVKVETSFNKFKRLVRDLAKEQKKDVQLVMEGLNVELDRKILEELNTPLVHLLRNAIDHGIETPEERLIKKKNPVATIKLKTHRLEGSVFIEVEDDGRGVNFDAVRQKLIENMKYTPGQVSEMDEAALLKVLLLPGFSTRTEADMVSGRGMGLAIVDKAVHALSGNLEIKTKPSGGSIFTIKVPFTRAILKVQILSADGDLFGIPIEHISQIHFLKPELIEEIEGSEYYKLGENLYPIIFFSKIMKTKENFSNSNVVVICKQDELNQFAVVFDGLKQQVDSVIKPFSSSYSRFSEILGSTITGDGSICLILDVMSMMSTRLQDPRVIRATDKI